MSDGIAYDATPLVDVFTAVIAAMLNAIWNIDEGTGLLPILWDVFYTTITGGEMLYAMFILCFAGGIVGAIKFNSR